MRTITSEVLEKLKSFGSGVRIFISSRVNNYTLNNGVWENNEPLVDLGVALTFKKDIGADFLRSNSQKIEAEIKGAHDLSNKELVVTLRLEWGQPLQEATIPLGVFVPKEWSINAETGNTVVSEGYDRLLNFQQEYEELSVSYPVTIGDFLKALASRLKLNITLPSGGNLAKELAYDIYKGVEGYTFRTVLDDILQGVGLSARVRDNELEVFNPTGGTPLSLVETDFSVLKVGEAMPVFNVLNLAREPQHDNYFYPETLPENKVEFVIENNLLSDLRRAGEDVVSLRAEFAPDIFSKISTIGYRQFNSKTWGFPHIEALDKVSISGIEGVEPFESYVMRSTLVWDGSFTQTIEAVESQFAKEKYVLITDRERQGIKTEIKVDKQAGEIELLSEEVKLKPSIYRQPEAPEDANERDLWLNTTENIIYYWDSENWLPTSIDPSTFDNYYTKAESDSNLEITSNQITSYVAQANSRIDAQGEQVGEITSQMSEITQKMNEVNVLVQGVGGSNLLRNSTGLKGNITEWQEFDSNGALIDEDNNGEVVQDTDIRSHSEAGSGIKMVNQYILQRADVIIGGVYTIYFRFKKNDVASVFINDEEVEITVDDYVDDSWATFKYQFTTSGNEVVIKFDNTEADEQSYLLVSDVVLKLGDCNGWQQAPNESYGKNFRLDKDGLSISSETSGFSSLLNEVQFSISDSSSNKNMLMVDKDSSFLTKLTVQDELVIQRYGNEEKATRIIPTDTGSMVVVND